MEKTMTTNLARRLVKLEARRGAKRSYVIHVSNPKSGTSRVGCRCREGPEGGRHAASGRDLSRMDRQIRPKWGIICMCVGPRPDPNPHPDVTAGLPLGRRVRIGEKVESASLGDKRALR